MHRRIAGAVLLMLTAIGLGVPTASGEEEPSLTWGIAPALVDDEQRTSVRAELDPGEEYPDAVVVTNHSDQPTTFLIEASDGTLTETGDFDILPRDEAAVGGGAWIEIDERIEIPARQSAEVPFTVRVPEDAAPGDHPAGITAAPAQRDADGQVSFDARVGVRLHLRVSGELRPALEITELTTSYEGTWNPLARGTVTVTWAVTNTGNVRLGSQQLADLSGRWGLDPQVSRRWAADQREILPGQSASGSLSLPAWPVGVIDTRITAEASAVGDDRIEADLPTVSAQDRAWAVPIPQLAVLIVVLGGGSLLVRRIRTTRAERAELQRQLAEARTETESGLV